MSVADELQNLNDNILAAYTTIGNKGGTVPTNKNTDNLATAIGSIPNGGGGSEPGGNIKITAYDTTTGVISGGGFGSTAGTVYVLDRDTNTYVAQTVASWTPSSITLDTPVDLTTIEGTTSMAVVADDGTWSNKWLLTGDVAVSGWGKLYIKDSVTGTVYTISLDYSEYSSAVLNTSGKWASQKLHNSVPYYMDEIVGFQFGSNFNLSSIGDNFLAYCSNLTQPLVIPSGVTSIGNGFLQYCESFNQPLSIPSGVTSIGTDFMSYCSSFNQPINIPNLTVINDNFMNFCYHFNQPITIPSGVTSIGASFLANCYSFNQPVVIPNTVTAIGNSFLSMCNALNQPVTLSGNLTSIGNYFLSNCRTFNQPLSLPTASPCTIGNGFMSTCRSFAQPLVIPNNITFVGSVQQFLFRCDAFSELTVYSVIVPPGAAASYNICTDSSQYAKMYTKGITVKGTARSAWISGLPNLTSSPYRKLINGGE